MADLDPVKAVTLKCPPLGTFTVLPHTSFSIIHSWGKGLGREECFSGTHRMFWDQKDKRCGFGRLGFAYQLSPSLAAQYWTNNPRFLSLLICKAKMIIHTTPSWAICINPRELQDRRLLGFSTLPTKLLPWKQFSSWLSGTVYSVWALSNFHTHFLMASDGQEGNARRKESHKEKD